MSPCSLALCVPTTYVGSVSTLPYSATMLFTRPYNCKGHRVLSGGWPCPIHSTSPCLFTLRAMPVTPLCERSRTPRQKMCVSCVRLVVRNASALTTSPRSQGRKGVLIRPRCLPNAAGVSHTSRGRHTYLPRTSSPPPTTRVVTRWALVGHTLAHSARFPFLRSRTLRSVSALPIEQREHARRNLGPLPCSCDPSYYPRPTHVRY